MKNKIVFFGTPDFAAHILRFLFSHQVPVVGIVTQPDRPRGRSMQVSFSPVKEAAVAHGGIPILQPEKCSNPEFLQQLSDLHADLYVVVAFGQILPRKLLAMPPLGCINVHVSLLPKYRGAAPMQRSLLAGDKETGVAIQKMVYELDAGDVIATSKMVIPESMTFGELQEAFAKRSETLLLDVLQQYERGIPAGIPQDPSGVTLAPKIDPAELEIDWNMPAEKIHNQVRAFSPRPGAWCYLEQGVRRIKILRTRVAAVRHSSPPGTLLRPQDFVACGEGAIELLEVQPEGKRAMPATDWLRGVSGFNRFPLKPSY